MRLKSAFVQTLGVQIVQSALSVCAGVLTARGLGPVGQGTYAMLATGILLGALIGSLGQFQSNVIATASRPVGPTVLLVRSLIHTLAVGLALLIIGRFAMGAAPPGVDALLVEVCIAVATCEVFAQLVRGINLGQHHVVAYNVSTVLQRAIQAAGVGALSLAGRMTVARVMDVWILATLVSVLFSTVWIIQRSPAARIRISDLLAGWGLMFSQGGRAFAAVALVLLLIRCDIWMLQPMLGTRIVGQFSVATSLAEWLWYIPTIAGNLLFAVVAADAGPKSAQSVARVTRGVLAFSIPVAATLMFGGRQLVGLLYGAEYATAGVIFVALVPGMTAIAVHLVVDAYFAGIGFPAKSVWAAAASLGVKVLLNLVLVPHFGALGAAAATCLVYGALLIYKLTWFHAATGLPWRSILLASRADLIDGLSDVRSWLRRRLVPVGLEEPRRAA